MLKTQVVAGIAFRGSAVAILKLVNRISSTFKTEKPFNTVTYTRAEPKSKLRRFRNRISAAACPAVADLELPLEVDVTGRVSRS